eukprot:m.121099 g.121099  ORF g.121099 m.121099 type:complete len:89 (-) comp13373_c1_seq2:2739-3005(-)
MFGVEDIPESPDSACVAAKVVYNAMKEAFQVDEIEPIKLHKLLLFAQAIAAAVFDVPLIVSVVFQTGSTINTASPSIGAAYSFCTLGA